MKFTKQHIFIIVILVVLAFFVLRELRSSNSNPVTMMSSSPMMEKLAPSLASRDSYTGESMGIAPYEPSPNVANSPRMTIQNSYLSLLVQDVVTVREKILSFVEENGGYMVTSETNNPQDNPTATITVRVPTQSLPVVLQFFRTQAVKVISENLTGQDVTDEYIDIDERIKQLQTTKDQMETLLRQSQEISDLVNITQQIQSFQSQIDSLIGQQKSLSQNAALSKISVYLATDELALPYTPDQPFRPNVIFKLAVRSLFNSLQTVASYVIWTLVYGVVWVPILIVVYVLYRRMKRT